MLKNYLEKAQFISNKQEAASKLLKRLNSKYKAAWTETVENINMKYSSRKAWTTINKLNEWMNTDWTLIEHYIDIRTEQITNAFLATQ